ncbi:MAG: hypothetical protein AAB914_01325 [Patescibacteria group bacterium]
MSSITKDERSNQEILTFANFNPEEHYVYGIGGDVIPQMAQVFGHNLTDKPDVENLGKLIREVGPAKTLQDNIHRVERQIGTNDDAIDLARSWVEKSGLLLPVNRSFLDPNETVPSGSDAYIITSGAANWMHRRADTLITEIDCVGIQIGRVVLAAGNQQVKGGREDVTDGITEYWYMKEIIEPKLNEAGIEVDEVIEVNSGLGRDVAEQAVKSCIRSEKETITVVSNAGVWAQDAGQIGRAMVKNDIDPKGRLHVISDDFPLGTGKESASTHQNPLTALGLIVRSARAFVQSQG